jgi:uncharacterized membrane protein YdjX (TVP38/TMEM64 family)
VKRYAVLVGGLLCFFLTAFLVGEAVGIPVLQDPVPWLRRGGSGAAALGVGLLVGDVFLPVPSSVVMVMHGTMFGVAAGALLSLAGSLGAAALGFLIGRRGGGLVERLVSPEAKERADRFLQRWGTLAIIVTRPVPLLAESMALLAGTSPLGWRALLVGTMLGAGPPSLIYAVAGSLAPSMGSSTLAFAAVIAISGLGWWIAMRQGRKV